MKNTKKLLFFITMSATMCLSTKLFADRPTEQKRQIMNKLQEMSAQIETLNILPLISSTSSINNTSELRNYVSIDLKHIKDDIAQIKKILNNMVEIEKNKLTQE